MIEQYHDPWLDPLEPCVLCRSKIIQIGTLYTGDNSDTILLCIHKLAHIYLLAYMLSNCNFICNLYMFKNACIVSWTCQNYFSYMFPVCVVSTVILCCSDCVCHFLLASWIRNCWFIFLDLEQRKLNGSMLVHVCGNAQCHTRPQNVQMFIVGTLFFVIRYCNIKLPFAATLISIQHLHSNKNFWDGR